jgi:hypothetical protein
VRHPAPVPRKKDSVLKFRRAAAVALVAGTGLAAVTGVGSAAASPAPQLHVVTTLPGDFIAPLQFAVNGTRIYVADSAKSALFRLGDPNPIATGPTPGTNPEASGDLAGVDARNGRVAFTTTEADHKNTYLTVLSHGKQVLKVNLGAYERWRNPDAGITYGATEPGRVGEACKAELAKAGAPLSYPGQKDSHPYAVTGLSDGSWLVADAGANDILRVSRWGHISTVAVLPAQPVRLTTTIAAQLSAPSCVGITYRFEAVPTDVEVANGHVYVSTLPGGAGGLGSVYTLGRHARPVKIAGGFTQATNLAVSPSGCIYVVELGVGIFTPGTHGPKQVADLPGAAAVEWANGKLYASTAPAVSGGTGPGQIVVLK